MFAPSISLLMEPCGSVPMEGGVFRYDGREFTNYTEEDGLLGNKVNSSHSAPTGAMWFGEHINGISRYDGKEFTRFTVRDGIIRDTWRIYSFADGSIWFIVWKGYIYCYDEERFTGFTTVESLRKALEEKHSLSSPATDSIIWAPLNSDVCLYDGRKFVNLTPKDGFVNEFQLTSTERASDGKIWFGLFARPNSQKPGLSFYDGGSFVHFAKADGLLSDIINAIYIDEDDVVWMASGYGVDIAGRGGLSRYDSKNFLCYTTKDGLPDDNIRAIGLDANGGNVDRYCQWSFLAMVTGISSHSILRAKRGYQAIILTSSIAIPAAGCGSALAESLPTSKGLSIYDNDSKRFQLVREVFAEIPTNRIGAIHSSSDGIVWIAVGIDEIFRYDGKKFDKLSIDDGPWLSTIYALHYTPDDAMWLATRNGGIYRYPIDSGKN